MNKSLKKIIESTLNLDAYSIAIFRIILGLVAFYDILLNFNNLAPLFSPQGVLQDFSITHFSLLNYLNFRWGFYIYFSLGLIFSIFIIIGFWSQLFTFLTWFILLNIQARNPLVLNFGDKVLLFSLFWGIFLPLGKIWSIDLKKEKAPIFFNFGIIFQFLILYLYSFYFKYGNTWRVDFTAVQWALELNFQTPLVELLLKFPYLLKVLTISVLLIESLIALGVVFLFSFPRLKTFCVFLGIFFHLGIKVTLDHGYFPYICMALWILFLPEWFWLKFLKKFKFEYILFPLDWKNRSKAFLMTVFILVVFWLNLRTANWRLWDKTPAFIDKMGTILSLQQAWSIYASNPPRITQWKIIKGLLSDGKEVNLLVPGTKFSEQRPTHYLEIYSDQKWTSFLSSLSFPYHEAIYLGIGRYFCSIWNTVNSNPRLNRVQVTQFSQENYLMGKKGNIQLSETPAFKCP